MNFNEIIRKSEIILIEGAKKEGKLTLALFESKNEKTVIFSAYQKSVFLKRLNAVANLSDENIQAALSMVKFFTLKKEWLEYKIKYGYEFMFEDIKRIIKKHNPKNIIFHRLDLMLGSHCNESIPVFMEKLISLKEISDFKCFITVITNEENEAVIESIENYCDLNIEIKKEKERILQIKNSIFPVTPDKYHFKYDNGQITIYPAEKEAVKTKNTHILLITENKKLIALHKYIFGKKGFFVDVAAGMSDTINKILSGPDIIIYNPGDEKLDLSVCNTIKQKKIPSKLIYITNSEYVRTDDKMKAIESGCYEMFPLNFTLGEYVLEIEKLIGSNFYTNILNKLVKNKTVNNLKHFCEIVNSLYEEKIFFLILKFFSKEKPDSIREKLRNTDVIFHNQKTGEYILCLINIRKTNVEPVLKKLFESQPEINIIESTHWSEKKEEICK